MSADRSIAPPVSIAGFVIAEKLGTGSFSTVYKALSSSPGSNGVRSTVAIKCIDRKRAIASRIASDCVVAEIAILKRLKHRHIVQLMDFHWDRCNVYLIIEFCGGGDLADFIRRHESLSERISQRCFQQLASALHYMRQSNIAHMDLKPQNILLTNRKRPFIKVSDFGLAQCLSPEDRATEFRGSPLYMAPEIFTRRDYDSRVDLWSCGVILFECLYGRAPFLADSYEGLVMQIKSTDSIKFPDTIRLTESCKDLLSRLLIRNPHHRITFDQFFSHSFVDLFHLPPVRDLEEAERLAQEASQVELEGNRVKALKLLLDSLALYVPSLAVCEDDEERERTRSRVNVLMKKAEDLKKDLRPSPESASPPIMATTSDRSSMRTVKNDLTAWQDTPQVSAAVLVAEKARECELSEKWNEALNKYQLAIESALHLLHKEPNESQRRLPLQSRVKRWLTRAEHIKMFLEVLEQNSKVLQEEANETEIEREIDREIEEKSSCLIQ